MLSAAWFHVEVYCFSKHAFGWFIYYLPYSEPIRPISSFDDYKRVVLETQLIMLISA